LWYTNVPTEADMGKEIDRRLALQKAGSMLPFAITDPKSGKAVGITTYMAADAVNRRVEIGYTWYRKSVQRTAMNTSCKLMLLTHAFEKLDCIAVEFRTHFFNHASRRGIERLGAKLDGILRSHQISRNGTLRDTSVYSIIASEWPTVKGNLTWQLSRPRG
jgi:RimJ/RimL family protein N-acetyltransferase